LQQTKNDATPRIHITRGVTVQRVIAAVFLTAELLENILDNVAPQQLLRIQAVAKQWRDVIGKSTVLQQKLFLAPVRPVCRWGYERRSKLGTSDTCRFSKVPVGTSLVAEASWKTLDFHLLNPLLKFASSPPWHITLRGSNALDGEMHSQYFSTSTKNCIRFRDFSAFPDPKKGTRRTRSFDQMYLTQPPFTRTNVEVLFAYHPAFEAGTGVIRFPDFGRDEGLRFIDVVEKVREAQDQMRRTRQSTALAAVVLYPISSVISFEGDGQYLEENDGTWLAFSNNKIKNT
jgi:hypothetical protein